MIGLFMIEPYCSSILGGYKTYDARAYNTKVRGKIAIIDSKSHYIKGYIHLVDVKEISFKDYLVWHDDSFMNCNIPDEGLNKKYYAWIMENPIIETKKIRVQRLSRNPWISLEV